MRREPRCLAKVEQPGSYERGAPQAKGGGSALRRETEQEANHSHRGDDAYLIAHDATGPGPQGSRPTDPARLPRLIRSADPLQERTFSDSGSATAAGSTTWNSVASWWRDAAGLPRLR